MMRESKRCPSSIKLRGKTYHPYPGYPNVFEGEKGKKAAILQCKDHRTFTGRSCRVVAVEGGYCKMTKGRLWRDIP